MSTILDALRKLQRERAATDGPGDLHQSIASETPLHGDSPPRGRRLVATAVGLGALLGGVAFGGLVFLGKIELPDSLQVWRSDAAQAAEAVEVAEVVPVPPPLPTVIPEAAVIPEPPPVASNPQVEAVEERARLEAARAEAARAEAERAQAEAARIAAAVEASRAASPPPTEPGIAPLPPPVPVPEPAAVAPPPEPVAEPAPEPPPAPKKKTVAVAKKVEPKPAPKPDSEPERARPSAPSSPPPDTEVAPYDPAFPSVRVEKIRWHPLKERRVVTLHFESQSVPDAHEGDIVAGVLVKRIDPGAVELGIGSATKLVRPGS